MRRRAAAMAGALALAAGLAAAPAAADGASPCGARTAVRQGESLADVAQRCGVNVETLKQANPGILRQAPGAGTFVVAPPQPLPSPRVGGGNRSVVPGG